MAKFVSNLAQNLPRHDGANFGLIVKTKGKTTIYHNDTLQSTKYYSTLATVNLCFFWLIVTLGQNGHLHGRLIA
jgi:hypothetical protein